MKRKLDEPLFELLARDPAASVRHHVACNAKCPTPILGQLTGDPESFVREAARERLERRS